MVDLRRSTDVIARTCRSWRCSTSLNEQLIARRARSRSPSTTTAARASAARAALVINGDAHGPERGTTTCQLHMRSFNDGDTIDVEPWRAARLPGHQGPGRRPRRLRPDHPGRRLHHRADRQRARRATPSRCPRPTPTPPWTRPPASAAAPAWRPARTARPCSSPRPRSPTSTCCRRASPSATPGSIGMVDAAWTRRASAAARTTASARRSAPRGSRSTSSPG